MDEDDNDCLDLVPSSRVLALSATDSFNTGAGVWTDSDDGPADDDDDDDDDDAAGCCDPSSPFFCKYF